jgi:O-antigen/teichoic acid export membrane protein
MILRTLVTNSGINALGLVNVILLSRWLGPTGRGEIAAAFLWPGLLIYLGSMGLITSTMYFSSVPQARPRLVLSTSIILGVLLSAIVVPVGFLAMPWLLHSQSGLVINASRLYLVVVPLSLLNQFGIGVLQGRLRLKAVNWLNLIIPAGYLLGTLALMITGKLVLMNIVVLHLCLNGAVLVFALLALAAIGIYPARKADIGLAKQMLSYGAKFQVGQIFGAANLNLDQALIAAWLPPAALGLYVVAVSSAGISQVFAGAVQSVSAPSIAQKDSAKERGELLQSVFSRFWLVSILIMLVIGAALPIVIPFIFGASFRSSVLPAEILLLASTFMGAKNVLSSGALALGDPWLMSKANMIALPVTLGFLLVLLPVWGLTGAAAASAAAYLAELAVVIYGLKRRHSISAAGLFRVDLANLARSFRFPGSRRAVGDAGVLLK